MADPAPRPAPLTPKDVAAIVEAAYSVPPRRSLVGKVADAVRGAYSGFLGPGEPHLPAAPEGTPPRQFDYPVSANRAFTPRANEPISFYELRAVAERCTLLRSIIETCKNEEERFSWTIAPVEGSKRKDSDPLIGEITAALRRPDGLKPFSRWIRALREDSYIIDAPAVRVCRTRRGEPVAFEYIDGATIAPRIDITGRAPRDPDLPAYDQIIHGTKHAEFTRRELVYLPRNSRSNHVYGFSEVEQGLLLGSICLNREMAQLLYFSEGNIPNAFVKAPKEWTPDQLKQAQAYWAQYKGDLAFRAGLVVVPEAGIQEFRPPPLKDDFDEWLARLWCSVFNVSPVPFIKQGLNRATGEIVQETAIDQGLIPRQMYWADFIGELISIAWGVTDVVLQWQPVRDPDPEVQAKIAVMELAHGIRTINECREEKGLAPVKGGENAMLMLPGAGGPILLTDISEGAFDPQTRAAYLSLIAQGQARGKGISAGEATTGQSVETVPRPKGANALAAPAARAADDGAPAGKKKRKAQATGEAPLAAAVAAAAPGKTVATVPKSRRNFWQAERAPLPPRARPNDDWRDT